VGFGIAQPVTSTMKRADLVTAHVSDDDGSVVAVDRYTEDENVMPQEDCQQDWQVVSGRQVNCAPITPYPLCALPRSLHRLCGV